MMNAGIDEKQARKTIHEGTIWVDIVHDRLVSFNSRSKKSTNIIWLRLRSVPVPIFNKQLNVHPIVAADKKIPLQPIQGHLLEALYKLRPGRDTIDFTLPDGNRTSVHILVSGIFSDMIARQEITRAKGAAGYVGCDYCVFNATNVPQVLRDARFCGESIVN